MKRYRTYCYVCLLCVMTILAGCSSWEEPMSVTEERPLIFPDYSEVTVPSNIAPLNFMVEGADRIQSVFSVGDREVLRVSGKEGVIDIPLKKWKEVLSQAAEGNLSVTVALWNEDNPEGVEYEPFHIYVSEDEIDEWVAYRLIEPGYVGWRQLGIYQRNLTDFDESAVVTNRNTSTTCINCHNFPSYSPKSMMFHARGVNGGTILYDAGKVRKIDFKQIGLNKNTTYPAWNPDGRYIAFSANTTHQFFYCEGRQQVEVFDTASDLLIYDIQTGEAITDSRFATGETLETFPTWSPDGEYLYFASHKTDSVVTAFVPGMQYDLLRVRFDKETRTFGERVDTIYNARACGGSVSHPRVSPDGRYLLYTWSESGTFPVWHDEADLRMIDLESMEHIDVSVWNDDRYSDSYHSWSSDGRWVVFGSRRLDGRYTRLFMAHLDSEGKPHKPFLLPQEDPRHNMWRLRSYNIPEFITDKVKLPKEAEKIFRPENR